jgi:predicted  nucleic acid-binding Zn-ribbon protein
MLDAIQKLLILQDRDRKIALLSEELARVAPQRASTSERLAAAQNALEQAKHRAHQLESDRKRLELDVEARKELIARYSLQQFQTRKNEEYRALAHEIETCTAAISKLEDQELEIMDLSDQAAKAIVAAQTAVTEFTADAAKQLAELDRRGTNLARDVADLQTNRAELAAAVEDTFRARYERLLKAKGTHVVVGVERGACGGCHMRVTAQMLVDCRAQQAMVNCPNCGRILYFDSNMDTTHDD